MKLSLRSILLISVPVICLGLSLQASPVEAQLTKLTKRQCADFPTFPCKSKLFSEVLSPANSEVIGMLNNMPVQFIHSKTFQKQQAEAEPILFKALRCARKIGSPQAIVDCLANLGCLYFIAMRYKESEKFFRESVEEARAAADTESPALAPYLEYYAMAARACGDYDLAEELYKEAFQLRTNLQGYYHGDTAYSLMALSGLYHDKAISAEDPRQVELNMVRAHSLECETNDQINSAGLEALIDQKMSQALSFLKESRTETNKELAWNYLKRSRELASEVDQLTNNMVLVTSRARKDVFTQSNQLFSKAPRPFYPCLPANNRSSPKLPKMISFAQSVISRCPNRLSPQEPGLAFILGNWSIPTDAGKVSTVKTMHREEKALEGILQVSETRSEEISPVENVPIYLCKYPVRPNNLLGRLMHHGKSRGLEWGDLGDSGTTHGWPATHEQAEKLQKELNSYAEAIAWDTTKTDTKGDYEFANVPKGDYFLYASVCTKQMLKVWLIPEEKIAVRKISQFRYDFVPTTGATLWEAGRHSAPMTPPSYFFGTQVTTPQSKSGVNDRVADELQVLVGTPHGN